MFLIGHATENAKVLERGIYSAGPAQRRREQKSTQTCTYLPLWDDGAAFSSIALPHGLALTDSAVWGLSKKLKRRARRQRRRRPAVAHVAYFIVE